MGTYTDFCIGDYSVLATKSQVDDTAMTVFRETDRYSRVVTDNDEDEVAHIGYSASTGVVRDRLDLMGFTLARSKSMFEVETAAALAELREDSENAEDLYSTEIEFIENLSFERWLTEFSQIRIRNIESWQVPDLFNRDLDLPFVEVSSVQRFMLDTDRVHWFGFPRTDFRYFLRAALAECADSVPVTQDVTYLVQGGYYPHEIALADMARENLLGGIPANTPIVVLTEGSSDRAVLIESLSVLYPHLSEYFTFMDFSQLNVPGGAPYLVSVIKAFAAAAIANRVIAVFDNDTAARSALAVPPLGTLPSTIRIVCYPPIDLASTYPTIGPDGPTVTDVNGRAGSIELYFGTDILLQDNGTLMPVQWRGYDEKLRAYQGELVDKRSLQRKFLVKARCANESTAGCLNDAEWGAMRAVIDVIRKAFE